MALGFYITGKGFTQERYDTTLAQLEEAGAGAPRAASPTSPWRQVARYRSSTSGSPKRRLRRSGTLLPILNAAGIELNEPMVARVHNEIKG